MQKIIKFLSRFILLFLLGSTAHSYTPQFEDLSIVVSSCDRYSNMWEPFFTSLFKNWPSLTSENSDVPIYLIANEKSYEHSRVTTLNIEGADNWSNNLIAALKKVDTKYVLISLDDYWIDDIINEKRLSELFGLMQSEKIAMLQLSDNDPRYHDGKPHPFVPGVVYRDKFSHYKASLQMAIWDKNALLSILRPGEDPWTFEIAGSIRAHGYPGNFLSLMRYEPIHYINAMHQGYINPKAIEYAKQNNISFSKGNFTKLGWLNINLKRKVLRMRIKKFISFIKKPGNFYNFEKSF